MRRLSIGLIAVALLVLAVVGGQGLGRADEPAEGKQRAKIQWEYRSVGLRDAALAKLGEEGWEAYAATVDSSSKFGNIYLKRVKQ